MTLAIGDIAPDFEAQTTEGPIRFHDWIGPSVVWASKSGAVSPMARVIGDSPSRVHGSLPTWAPWRQGKPGRPAGEGTSITFEPSR